MIRRRLLPALAILLFLGLPAQGADDQIERLLSSGRVPKDMIRDQAHSDFADPLGKFMDFLAAGAFDRARALRPQACAAWRTSRQETAWTGKLVVWDTEIDLDTLCAALER
jgi:hypothetical protein